MIFTFQTTDFSLKIEKVQRDVLEVSQYWSMNQLIHMVNVLTLIQKNHFGLHFRV